MNKLELLGNKYILPTGSLTTLAITNTILDAVDTVKTGSSYVHAASSTLRNDYDQVLFSSSGTDVDLAGGQKYSMGVFIINDITLGNLMYSVIGNLKFISNSANTGVHVTPFFGRMLASTITQSNVTPSNQLGTSILLPNAISHQQNSSIAGYQISANVKEDIMVDNSGTDEYPLCFGYTLYNTTTSTVCLISDMLCYLQIRCNSHAFQLFRTTGA